MASPYLNKTPMNSIDTHDVQGLITKGYASLPACRFVLLAVNNKGLVKKWLKGIAEEVTHSSASYETAALNIAFTFDGLKELGLPAESMETFPLEFEDGMTTAHKQLFLGDFGTSAPSTWEWGGKQNDPVHILLMIYAASEEILSGLYAKHETQFANCGLTEHKQLDTTVLIKRKEHFGFHDGIAQPTIEGLNRKDIAENTVATGEFILGYKNSYGQYPPTPMVAETTGDSKLLAAATETGMRDLGKNGSYLVFRQMEQDVALFWDYMEKATCSNDKGNTNEMIKLASKMVGRWPGGSPISLCPDKDEESMENHDDFGYRHTDGDGLKCPIGAHIRRTNPRDSLDTSHKASVGISNKHRILRRGRSYGKPVCESLDPVEILRAKNITGTRGLHFICVNTDISRQFEFIQNAWVNSPKFLSLYDERDPIIGNNHGPESESKDGIFSTPTNGLRKRHTDVPQFVTVKGGAYFFMPGIKALTFLSSI
jgi:Dyp-type peroxidase family